jgi:hypothetical protein
LSTILLCLCTEQGNIVGREYINITQKLTIFGSGRQSYLQSCLELEHTCLQAGLAHAGIFM